jgi:hypothetical protein
VDGVAVEHDGGEGATADAGHAIERELAVGRGGAGLDAEAPAGLVEEDRGTLQVAGGAAADADGVASRRLEAEQVEEGGDAPDARGRDAGFAGDPAERAGGEVPLGALLALERGDQPAGFAGVRSEHAGGRIQKMTVRSWYPVM